MNLSRLYFGSISSVLTDSFRMDPLKFFLIFFLDGEGNEIGCRRRSMGCHTSVTAVARMIQPLQRCHQAEPWADNGGQNFISAPKLDQVRP